MGIAREIEAKADGGGILSTESFGGGTAGELD